ncbi:MAG: hypothetical protein GQ570_06670 [Helicobacteraceae bacterium]|nr:hypothetical protein [Helicobacteraceae bacterium]
MSYLSWFREHSLKHLEIVKKLEHLNFNDKEIIEYFNYENISKKELDFCPLFLGNKKCHDLENLNCYLCACPNFRFNDNVKNLKSHCSINSKDGNKVSYKNIVHQDCSKCVIPHKVDYIEKYYSREWSYIMRECNES